MHSTSIILIFIKAPVKGQVKTRLASAIGEDTAFELYRNFILDTVDTVEKTGYPFRICFSPPDAGEAVASWLGGRYQFMPQKGKDLGQRMENAFLQSFSEGNERAVLIGSDIPDLVPEVLHEAISSLEENDAVIGPAFDGGYYLIGFKKGALLQRVFHGIRWSEESVFQETMTLLQDSAFTIHRTTKLHDVDTVQDLRALFERNKDAGFDKSRTMTYLIKNPILGNNEEDGS